jgi:hypothetical protein
MGRLLATPAYIQSTRWFQNSSGSLSGLAVEGLMGMYDGANFATRPVLYFGGLRAIANDANPLVWIENTNTTGGSSATALLVKSNATGSSGARIQGQLNGMTMTGVAGDGLYLSGAQNGLMSTGTVNGGRFVGTSSDGLNLYGGLNGLKATGDGNAGGHFYSGSGGLAGLVAEGTGAASGFWAKGYGAGITASQTYSPNGPAIVGGLDWVDTARNASGGGPGGSCDAGEVAESVLAIAIANSSVFGGTPTGVTNSVTVYAYDTSVAPDLAIQYVTITAMNAAGQDIQTITTDSYGRAVFSLPAGDYTFKPWRAGYAFSQLTRTISGAVTDAQVKGYNINGLGRTCRVYGSLVDDYNNPVWGAEIQITPPAVSATCDTSGLMSYVSQRIYTNATGVFELNLLRSSCLGGGKYTITAVKPGMRERKTTVLVPDASSSKVVW